jgi:GR25 family glycosyltransferase involved in LPS biosynthesis
MGTVKLSWDEVQQAPVFVINMDECKDRMTITESRIRNAGYTDIRRISAVDARNCNLVDEWNKYGNPKFNTSKSIETEFEIYLGKQGCLLSWLKTLQKIISLDIKVATVFEDDVLFHKDFALLAPEYYKATPDNFELCYLGSQIDWPFHTPEISKVPVFCTHAIILTLEGAKKLYNFIVNNPDGVYTIDWMMKDMAEVPSVQHAYIYYVWNAMRFHDPAREMPKGWIKRNCGLVFQDYYLGSFVREY